jgi:phage terminase small subunit
VAAEVARRQKMLSEKTEITHEMVLERYWMIATANPNELAQYRRENCRHCWGDGHLYQWTEPEYQAACQQAKEDGLAAPPEAGGFGFDPTRLPHPDCPQCRGEGVGRVFVTDTRKLSPEAAALYAGVKLGKDGLEVKTHNQLAALDAVGRHIGFFKDKVEVSTGDFDPATLGAVFAAAMAKSRAMTEAMRRDREGGEQ